MSLSRSRPRFQLMKPMTRLSRKSAKPGMGAGLEMRIGDVRDGEAHPQAPSFGGRQGEEASSH